MEQNQKDLVRKIYRPDEIFPKTKLKKWAQDNGYWLLSNVGEAYLPEEIFSVQDLNDWAEANGWKK